MKPKQITRNKSTKEDIYESIVEGIRKKYKGQLTEVEAYTAARDLIEFVKIMLEVHKKSN